MQNMEIPSRCMEFEGYEIKQDCPLPVGRRLAGLPSNSHFFWFSFHYLGANVLASGKASI